MSNSDQEKTQNKGFTVTDRRSSSVSKSDVEEHFKAKKAEIKHAEKEPVSASKKEEGIHDHEQPPEEVTFSGLIFSLSHSAVVQMGEIPDPFTKEQQKNLAAAKQTIDVIGLLQEKTKGNLSKEEETLLQNILYDLRMRFVQNSASKPE